MFCYNGVCTSATAPGPYMSDAGFNPYDINGDGIPDMMQRAGTPTPFFPGSVKAQTPTPFLPGATPTPFFPGSVKAQTPTPFLPGAFGGFPGSFGTPGQTPPLPWNADPRAFPGSYPGFPQNNLYNPGPRAGFGGLPRRDDINHHEIRSLGELDALLRGDPERRTLVQFYDSAAKSRYFTHENEWKNMARDYINSAVFARVDTATVMGARFAFDEKKGKKIKKRPVYRAFNSDGRPLTGSQKAYSDVDEMREWVETYH